MGCTGQLTAGPYLPKFPESSLPITPRDFWLSSAVPSPSFQQQRTKLGLCGSRCESAKSWVFPGWGPEEKPPPLSQRLPRCGLHGRGCLREEGHLCWWARLYGVSSGVSKVLPLHCLGPHTSSGCSGLDLRGRRPRCVLESCQRRAEAGARFPETAVLPQETRSLIAAQ